MKVITKIKDYLFAPYDNISESEINESIITDKLK